MRLSNKHVSIVLPSELKDEYVKEKQAFDGNPEGLESWLENLRAMVQGTKVDNDVKLTQGSKLAKFMARKKKLLKSEMMHMSKFDVHTMLFVVAGRPDAYAAHAQNAIIFGSPEIKKIAEGEFNLKNSLNDLFVKVMHERLDGSGLSKWHEDTEKVEKAKELRSRDTAYSAASKYLKNLFVDHVWFPSTVPWTRLLPLLAHHHVRIIGWPLEAECPAPHPQRNHKLWDGAEWRCLVSEFHKGKECPIKIESWNSDEDNDNTDIALIIDRTGTVVYRVRDAVIEHPGSDAAGPSSSKARRIPKDSSGRFAQKAKSKVSSTDAPASKRQKGKKALPKSAELINSGDEIGDNLLGSDAPSKPPALANPGPILPQHSDDPQTSEGTGHDLSLVPMGNPRPHVGLPEQSNFAVSSLQAPDGSQVDWSMLYHDMMQHGMLGNGFFGNMPE
jgi:hypothetical protein